MLEALLSRRPRAKKRIPGLHEKKGMADKMTPQGGTARQIVRATIHFIDGTKITLRFPRQSGTDETSIVANVKKALEAEQIVAEVDGDLLVIPMKNVKYIQLSPAPPSLPDGALKNVIVKGVKVVDWGWADDLFLSRMPDSEASHFYAPKEKPWDRPILEDANGWICISQLSEEDCVGEASS
jgi:hypothetical protein